MKNLKRIKRIGLITPYGGCNLGDGAIQDAVIANVRKRIPDSEIIMFSLDPARTSYLHGVDSLPITGLPISSYSTKLLNNKKIKRCRIEKSSKKNSIWERIKNHPRFRSLLGPLWRFYKVIIISFVYPATEVKHIIQMFRLLRSFKMLIVSGGGQIDDYWGGPMGHPYSLFRWALIAKATKTKFVFLSVGVCSIDSKVSKFFIKIALRLSNYRSYRDQGSLNLISDLSFTKCDNVFPDLAFSYPLKMKTDFVDYGNLIPKLKIGLSPIAYLSEELWPKNNKAFFNRYLNCMIDFIVYLIKRDHEIFLFATDGPDKRVINLILKRVKLCFRDTKKYRLLSIDTYCVKDFFFEIDKFDCVIASRLHGVILSHLYGKPVLAISYDRKVTDYMKQINEDKFCVDIHHIHVLELINVFEMFTSDLAHIKNNISEKTSQFRDELLRQYDDLLG